MRHRYRLLYTMLALSFALTVVAFAPGPAGAQEPSRVGLVVEFGDDSFTTRCIEFDEGEITGYDVLRRSGLSLVAKEVSGMGVTICDIEDTSGCSASDCWCQCRGMSCMYWRYYHLKAGSWEYSSIGAAGHAVQHGDVEGWAWGDESSGDGGQPPVIPFEEICGDYSEPAEPAAPAPPTATPIPPTPRSGPALATATAVTPSSSLSPTTETDPTASPSPIPEMAVTPSPSPAPAEPTPTPPHATQAPERETNEELPPDTTWPAPPYDGVGYAAFGVIAAGLVGWLIIVTKVRG